MKKVPFLSLCLCPYGYIAVMLLLFLLSRYIPELDNDSVIFAVMGIFLLLPGILCLWYLPSVFSVSPLLIARRNLQLKLWNLPAVLIAIGILIGSVISTGRAAVQGAQEGGLAVFLWILLLLPVFTHSLFLLWTAAITAFQASKCTETRIPPVRLLLHWLPVADLAASHWLYRKLKG